MYSSMELSSNVPAFIAKLWHMVNDKGTDDLILWGFDGTTFVIRDHVEFASKLLPTYYKHNNMASFIRQLNMYGFHKVVSVDSSSLKNDRADLEFTHPSFCRGQPTMLDQIKRKITHHREIATSDYKGDPAILNKLLQEVQQLRSRQSAFDSKLQAMKNENDALWREQSILRQKHFKQQKIVNKLIQFLVTLVQQTRGFNIKRKTLPLMLKDSKTTAERIATLTSHPHHGPVICEVDPNEVYVDEDGATGTVSPSGNIHIIQPTEIILEPSNATIEVIEPTVKVSLKGDKKSGSKKRPIARSSNGYKGLRRKRKFSEVLPSNEDEVQVVKQEKATEIHDESSQGYTEPTDTVEFVLPDVVSPGGSQLLVCDESGNPITAETITTSLPVEEPLLIQAQPATADSPKQKEESKGKELSLLPQKVIGDDLDSHISTVDSDLDVLKDLLKGEGGLSLDANTLLELFSSEDPLNLNLPLVDLNEGSSKSEQSTELTTYVPNLVDMADIMKEADDDKTNDWWNDDLDLNTPQASVSALDFPISDAP